MVRHRTGDVLVAQRQSPERGETMQGTFLNSIDSISAQREQGRVNQESQVGALNVEEISICKDQGLLVVSGATVGKKAQPRSRCAHKEGTKGDMSHGWEEARWKPLQI